MSELEDVEINHISSRSAEDVAAERTRNSVRPEGGRKEGLATHIPSAVAMTPIVLSGIVKSTYQKAMGKE